MESLTKVNWVDSKLIKQIIEILCIDLNNLKRNKANVLLPFFHS